VRVIRWQPQLGKGVDDLVVNHGAAFHQAYQQARIFEAWAMQPLTRLTYSAQWIAQSRYLGKVPIPPHRKFIALKAPKGTGKTESFKTLVHQAPERGQPVILLIEVG
jgi:hypothetical protein